MEESVSYLKSRHLMAVLPEADSRMSATGTKEAGGIIKVR